MSDKAKKEDKGSFLLETKAQKKPHVSLLLPL
jgi:hypothetical protein